MVEHMNMTFKNLIKGAGTAIEISPAPNKTSLSKKHRTTVSASLRRDWRMVGDDLWHVVDAERKGDVKAKK
jgi:hypothetical protein